MPLSVAAGIYRKKYWAVIGADDLPRGVELDARLRSVGALPNPQVPAFTELGMRLGWGARRHLEVALIGDDLLHDRHPEFNPTAAGFEEFERSVRAVVTARF